MLDLVLRRECTGSRSEFWALRDDQPRDRVRASASASSAATARARARCCVSWPGSIRPHRDRSSIRGSVAPLIEMGAGFNPELSGADNIVFNGAMLGFSRSQMLEKADGIYEFTGLREFADMPLKYYSSGMYMRLAFAIATEVDPDILLIDEALGVGDAAFLEKAKARIRDLLERSNAVILVSHDMESLRELCTRGLWIQHGQLVADGPIDEVIDRYQESIAAARAAS